MIRMELKMHPNACRIFYGDTDISDCVQRATVTVDADEITTANISVVVDQCTVELPIETEGFPVTFIDANIDNPGTIVG